MDPLMNGQTEEQTKQKPKIVSNYIPYFPKEHLLRMRHVFHKAKFLHNQDWGYIVKTIEYMYIIKQNKTKKYYILQIIIDRKKRTLIDFTLFKKSKIIL